jgi:asparagine synthase (glutamine-hydrolysing)
MVKLDKHNPISWTSANGVWVAGYCFDTEGNFYEKESLIALLQQITENHLESFVRSLNGIFDCIIERDSETIIIMDKTRLIPLFYAIENSQVIVSNNPYTLFPTSPVVDTSALNEYLYSSVVLDEKTLIKGIFQVQPSSYIICKNNHLDIHHYYTFAVKKHEIAVAKDYNQQFETVLNDVFHRLLTSCKGKQVVVPLSGGYDSRLIVCMLAKLGYKNVLCYTVGRPNNPELIIAQKVAKTLGYKHVFISNETPSYLDDNTFEAYYRYSGYFTNFFWMYEYVGVKTLTEQNIIEKDAIFTPGHSGDFLAGSQLQKAGITLETTLNEVEKLVLEQKFAYGNGLKNAAIKQKMNDFIKQRKDYLPYSVFDDVDLLIKLPKNINNAARIYGFFGHQTRLPFWDNEMIEFFKTLPIEEKQTQKFYHHYLTSKVFQPMNVAFVDELTYPEWRMKWYRFKRQCKQLLPTHIQQYISNPPDYVCMKEISAPLKQQLPKTATNGMGGYNRVFLEWYWQQVKKIVD